MENVQLLEVDKLGNIFILDDNAVLSMYNKNKVKLYEYADNRLGKMDAIDATNPMRIMIHFQDQGIIKIIDNTLAELQKINLYEDGKFNNITKIGRANDNNFWIYDEQLQRIFKVDGELKIIIETNFFKDFGISNFKPFYLRERNNTLIIGDKQGRCIVFDNYGQYIKSFDLGTLQALHFDGFNIYSLKADGLYKQNIQMPDYSKISIAEHLLKASQLKVENNILYFNLNNKLVIEKID